MAVVDRSEEFAEAADRAVELAARHCSAFIVDQVWQYVDGEYSVDKRAMGPAMLRAVKAKLIVGSEDYRPSAQLRGHATPRRIWISRIYTAPRVANG